MVGLWVARLRGRPAETWITVAG